MDKVVKREVVIQKESEKSAMAETRMEPSGNFKGSTADSRDSFWNSYPIETMTPEQRKHFKEIMRKEVRSK